MGKTDYSDTYPFGHRVNEKTGKVEVINIATQEVLGEYDRLDLTGAADHINKLVRERKEQLAAA